VNLQEIDRKYVANTYRRFEVTFVRGQGSLLWDDSGKEYIDLGTGIAVNTFGLCDPVWTGAVTAQLAKLQHTSNLYVSGPQAELAQMLCEKTSMSKVFFSNSGAEANECMIKSARKYAHDKYGEKRSRIITLLDSFHGRTVTTLAATGQDQFHHDFGPFTEGFVHVAPGDTEALHDLVGEEVPAAIMIEVIQGEGGVRVVERDFLLEIAELCRKKDILLLVDEVQTGNGRTGALYSYMKAGLSPDIFSTAKGLAGGPCRSARRSFPKRPRTSSETARTAPPSAGTPSARRARCPSSPGSMTGCWRKSRRRGNSSRNISRARRASSRYREWA